MRIRCHTSRRHGLTLVEVLVICACIAVVLVFLLVSVGEAPSKARKIKDSLQIRDVHQGFVIWATSCRDEYPLPSVSDTGDYVMSAGDATNKDTTANIYSLLIFGRYFTPEILLSPAEQSPQIEIDTDYHLTSPPTALNPAMALWDPAFSADFTSGKKGNTSYAHHIPSLDRRRRWSSTLQSNEAILGNRGPEVIALQTTTSFTGSITPIPSFATNSITFQIHNPRTSWEGNIAFNDNRVGFVKNVYSENATYEALPPTAGAKKRNIPDVFFFDEPDANNRDNAFMSIFTKAGPTTNDFSAIWD